MRRASHRPGVRMWRRLIGVSGAVPLLAAGALMFAGGAAAGPPTIDCSQSALTQAFRDGGSYVFAADCTLYLTAGLSLPAGVTLSLDTAGHAVELGGGTKSTPISPFVLTPSVTVDGSLTLTGMSFSTRRGEDGTYFGQLGDPYIGTPGTDGTDGSPGADGTARGQDGAPGTSGTAGSGVGGRGATVRGGALVVSPSGDVHLDHVTFLRSSSLGGYAGRAGRGGAGGAGGRSLRAFSNTDAVGNGGNGGDGARAGREGDGGDAMGGAIYNEGSLTVTHSTFDENAAYGGGDIGPAYRGGNGGGGGQPGLFYSGAPFVPHQGNGGRAADGSQAGTPGSGYGGAIYNTGSLIVSDTDFKNNSAGFVQTVGGNGGLGGDGPNATSGGDGGPPGGPASAVGGAVYSTKPWTMTGGTVSNNRAQYSTSTTPFPQPVASSTGFGGFGGKIDYFSSSGPYGPRGVPNTADQFVKVLGTASAPDFYPPPNHGGRVVGLVVRGPKVGVREDPVRPVAGVTVVASGTTADGAAFSGTGTTDDSGSYAIETPAGSYTVTFPLGECVIGPTDCTTTRAVTVVVADVTVDAIAVTGTLDVAVALSQPSLRLKLGKDEQLVPVTVKATVKLTNSGDKTLEGVTPQALQFAAVGGAKTPNVPLKTTAGPTPVTPTDLAPGKSLTVTYDIQVSGDGTYDVQALAVSTVTGVGRVAGVGSARLTVGAPLLVMASVLGRSVKSPDAPKLIRGGTAFTVKLTLRNLSYTHSLGVYPMHPDLTGNAADGHVATAGTPIQIPSADAYPQPSQAVVLQPRVTREMEIVVRTSATFADVRVPGNAGGGTRAVVEIPTPRVADLNEDETVAGEVAETDITVSGDRKYEIGIDDRDFRTPPPQKDFFTKAAYFSVGAFEGVWNLTGGVAVGLFKDVPLLLAKGIIEVPSAAISYMKLEAQLFDAIRKDPQKLAEFLNRSSNLALLAYEKAPGLVGSVTDFTKKFDAQVLEHYTKIANDESTGNYYEALREWSREGTEATGNLLLAAGVLTRLPVAAEALTNLKQASYTRVGLALNVVADGVGARGALTALKKAVPGYEFLTRDMRKFYGLSDRQLAYLRGFAKENRLIITIRSRAEESLKWLAEHAVLKPEQIKIKTVSIDDVNYLGYRESDLGRVVIREPPTHHELQRSLRRKGFEPGDPEWETAFRRRKDRVTEFNHPGYDEGYVQYLENADKKGELNLRWNLRHNSVDPNVLANGYTKYPMRLLDEGGGNRVLQFKVGEEWRSVTGDVDFLSIVHADGSPLSVAERIVVYRQMAKSPVGMLHPAADTWTLVKPGGKEVFDFDVKTNEFVRGGTAAQIGPDGVARAVLFNRTSRFSGPKDYRIIWDGGYTNVKSVPFR